MPTLHEIAREAIETARAIANGSKMLAEVAKAKGRTPGEVANRMLDELERRLEEATMKTVDGKKYPSSDFLVVEDPEKSSTWHLQVKRNGTAEPRLMGAAWAALHGGYRGNKYEGPSKTAAIGKLKTLYKSEDMEVPAGEVTREYDDMPERLADLPEDYGPLTFADLDAEDEARAAAAEASKRVYQYHRLIDSVMRSQDVDKAAALVELAGEFVNRVSLDIEQQEVSQVGEAFAFNGHALGDARDATEAEIAELDAAIESGRRAPVVVDFQMIAPGPGNERDGHYYPAEMLKRDAHVFKGADVFATDHKESERSERTKVGKVTDVPVRFLDNGAPVAQMLIYDPHQAEKARNRADAGQLQTLECSIFGSGVAKKGKVDGKDYLVVQELTQGKYLELVSKAGAGGHALNLAENEAGGADMSDKEKAKTSEVEEVKATEVDVAEGEQEDQKPPEQQEPEAPPEVKGEDEAEPEKAEEPLPAEEVDKLLAESNVPQAFKDTLKRGTYKDEAEAKAAVEAVEAEVKRITGSGQPFGMGGSPKAAQEAQQAEKQLSEAYDAIEQKYGIQPLYQQVES